AEGRRERRERDDRGRVGDRQPEGREVGPGEPAPRRAWRRVSLAPSLEQDSKPEPDQDPTAHHRERSPSADERRGQRGDAEGGDGGVEGVGGRDSETREQAGEAALEEGAPNAQDADR